MRFAVLALAILPGLSFAADRTVRFSSPMYFLPAAKAIVVTRANEPGPGSPKHEAVLTLASLKDEGKLTSEGPFDVWFVPKDGKPVRALTNWKAKDDRNEVKVNDHVGVISVRGDGQPRGRLWVTPEGDDGPESKSHKVIQTASDTRSDLVVAPGDYAVWVAPENGARPRRIADKVRVQAGKTATVD